jgi:hypothetical protein
MVGNKIDPFSDFGFKVVFGKEENKRLLISFLNSLLKGEYEIIPAKTGATTRVVTARTWC